jgi:hypothetical protein
MRQRLVSGSYSPGRTGCGARRPSGRQRRSEQWSLFREGERALFGSNATDRSAWEFNAKHHPAAPPPRPGGREERVGARAGGPGPWPRGRSRRSAGDTGTSRPSDLSQTASFDLISRKSP